MAMFNFIPPLIAETIYFNEVYYCIMYLIMTTTAVSLPYLAPTLPRVLKVASMLFAAWFFSSLAFNVMGIFNPEMLASIYVPTAVFTRYTLVFCATIVFLILNESWENNTTKN